MIDSDLRWWVRHLICQELEGVVRRIRLKGHNASGEIREAIEDIADAVEEHSDKIRGQLGAEAEEEARDDIKRREAAGEFVPSVYDAYRQENS